ncbi:hypothetical protein [Arcanobacterium buesumense]|uniref:Primosomal protein N' 3' DNA-binding domain-containing protein n=1 Tax=Arcanobacterium buesumense TaxID=2722751 RepID=A0A6H2EKZ5_9ACTO|nr:hypothetical protein [Arcanobacterium buesumense]QJC21763.1 hypothetical protein HC352_04075 [Arcanobacterium buesumense]
MNDLFSLPEYSAQEELLRLERIAQKVTSSFPNPVAHVAVDVPHVHMNTLFDYRIPEKYAQVPVGARVMVEFGSGKAQGFIVGRSDSSKFSSTLRPLKKVVSPVPVLDADIYRLAQAVSQRQSSTLSHCLRLAIPQRHARAEKEFLETDHIKETYRFNTDTQAWHNYSGGKELLEKLRDGNVIQAITQVRSVDSVIALAQTVVAIVAESHKSVIFVVPTAQQAHIYAEQLQRNLGIRVATMISDNTPEVRYRQFLDVKSGDIRVVVGTRSAAWAPAQNLGLVILLDDHHRAHEEPHNPYIHTRELLMERSRLTPCSFLSFNYGPSVELAWYVKNSASAQILLPAQRRDPHALAQVLAASSLAYEGERWSRMPSAVFTVVREGLTRGDVVVIVPRTGYIPIVACARCREVATCHICDGKLGIAGPDQPARCQRCGVTIMSFTCRHCRGTQLKPVRIGSHRTAQEIGRAFRNVPIHLAGVGQEISPADDEHRIVVSTAGQLPRIKSGFAAGVILDAGYMLRSENLDAEVYFLRALAHITTIIQPRSQGGQLLIVGDVPAQLILTIKNWDMYGWAAKALLEREELLLPPAYVWVQVTGTMKVLRHFLSILQSLAHDAGLSSEDSSLAALLGAGADELIPGVRVIGPYPGGQDSDLHVYLAFPQHEREKITLLISQAHRIISVQKLGRITIKMDTSV